MASLKNDKPAVMDASVQASSPSLIDAETLKKFETRDTSGIDVSHIKSGLAPPTNKWFSGFALQKDPKPGFSYPNSYRPLQDGFEMGLPKVTATSDTISGPHQADVVVKIAGATRYQVTRYDELTVDIGYFSAAGTKLATLTLGSGLPYAFLSAEEDIQVTSTMSSESYGVYNSEGTAKKGDLKVARGAFLSFFSAPSQDNTQEVARYAGNKVTSGSVEYRMENKNAVTELIYQTANHKPTMVVRMPHQGKGNASGSLHYPSIYGDLPAAATQKLTYSVPAIPVTPSLSLATLPEVDRNTLRQQLKQDITATKLDKPDTYFAGKQLYRAAQLLDIAAQLGATDEQQAIQTKLKTTLGTWLEDNKSSTRSFYYDPEMRGIVGNEASFGADKEFNDHYFHYGYFIYAASILAKYDDDFMKKYEDKINLLVADIANYKTGEALPLRRNFDAYAGHGWASGVVPFNDGNNQESSSEAMNAWVAVALWAQQTGNKTLETEGRWMLSNEMATAKKYWLQSNSENAAYLRPYTAPLVSLNWGGKRGYQTFFNNEPNAKLGIQLIPMSPSLASLIPLVSDKVFASHDPDGMFGDYITMAQANTMGIEDAKKLPESAIDDGDSRTYLYAWMLSY